MNWLLVILLLLTAGILGWCGLAPDSPRRQPLLGSREDILGRAAKGGYRIIETEGLFKLYGESPLRLLMVDTRPIASYQAGRIARAVPFPLLPSWWARFTARGALAGLLGSDRDRALVFY